ncbi:hypothetical protein ACQPZA_34330 [Pseudonocardia xinjiangensis]|uniref:hypothetical protein n=1 Tax=Pseudonocardia xinjiangensis TaxID=75289 RepID=UPI003D8B74C3
MSSPRTRTALVALAWTAAVVVATLVGMSAVGAIGTGILGRGQQALTPSQVDQALAAARAVPASAPVAPPSPTDPPFPPSDSAAAAVADVVTSPGGTIVARCTGSAVEIVSASPAQGFRLDDEREGSRMRFESEDTTVAVQLSCQGGRPVGAVEVQGDDDDDDD